MSNCVVIASGYLDIKRIMNTMDNREHSLIQASKLTTWQLLIPSPLITHMHAYNKSDEQMRRLLGFCSSTLSQPLLPSPCPARSTGFRTLSTSHSTSPSCPPRATPPATASTIIKATEIPTRNGITALTEPLFTTESEFLISFLTLEFASSCSCSCSACSTCVVWFSTSTTCTRGGILESDVEEIIWIFVGIIFGSVFSFFSFWIVLLISGTPSNRPHISRYHNRLCPPRKNDVVWMIDTGKEKAENRGKGERE